MSNTERLAIKYGRSFEEMQEMERNIAEMAAGEGIDFQWQQAKSGNSFNAHRIIHLAQSKGLGSQAEEAFFHAYMTEGLAIGEREVVEEIASELAWIMPKSSLYLIAMSWLILSVMMKKLRMNSSILVVCLFSCSIKS
jgi:hypothetical protein